MKFVRLKPFFLSLLAGVLLANTAFAAAERSGVESVKSDLGDIKARLASLESGQKEILAKEDQILAELDRIRIWVHRK